MEAAEPHVRRKAMVQRTGRARARARTRTVVQNSLRHHFSPPQAAATLAADQAAKDPSWAACDAATAASLPTPRVHDCLCGCVLTGDLVCGANGLTYDSDCLATCSGAAVTHKGACVVWIRGGAPPPDAHAGKGGSAASTAPLTVVEGGGGSPGAQAAAPRPTRQYHALAGMLDTSAGSGPAFAAPRVEAALAEEGGTQADAAAARRTVSAGAIAAFEADGFALVGAGRGPGTAAPAGAGKASGGVAGVSVPVASDHLRTVRYVVKSGLLYASVAPIAVDGAGGEDAAAEGAPRLVQPGHDAAGVGFADAPAPPAAAAPAGDDLPNLLGPGTGAAPAPAPATPRPARTAFKPSQWKQATKAPSLPIRTATLLTKRRARAAAAGSSDDEPAPEPAALADESSCSGVLIGRYVVGTAGRCLYDRATRKFASPLVARPGAFRGPDGTFNAPTGIFDAVMYSVMAGFGEIGNSTFFPDAFDVGAVITDGGSATRIIGDLVGGWMGFISDMAAFGRRGGGGGGGLTPEPEAPAGEAPPPPKQASLFLWAVGYPAISQSLGSLWQWAAACAPRGGWGGLARSSGGAVLDLPTTACPGGEGGLMGAPLFDTENFVRGFFTGFGALAGGGGGRPGAGGGIIDNFLAVTPTLFEFMKKSMALTPPPQAAQDA